MSESDSVMLGMKDLQGNPEFIFGIKSAAYDSLQRSTVWNWPAQGRAGRASALQYAGPGEDRITLAGTIFTEKVGLGQMDALRKAGSSGLPHVLIDQYGNVLGLWCVLSVKEDQSAFFYDGAPRKQAFTVELMAYGEDHG